MPKLAGLVKPESLFKTEIIVKKESVESWRRRKEESVKSRHSELPKPEIIEEWVSLKESWLKESRLLDHGKPLRERRKEKSFVSRFGARRGQKQEPAAK